MFDFIFNPLHGVAGWKKYGYHLYNVKYYSLCSSINYIYRFDNNSSRFQRPDKLFSRIFVISD